jgi:hypothetical protein
LDILLAQVTGFVGRLFMPIWITAVAGIVGYLLLKQQGGVNKGWEKKLLVIIAAAVIAYVPLFFISGMLLDHFANNRIEEFARRKFNSLVIHFAGKRIEIRDPRAIHDLLSLMCTARAPWSWHHSHAVRKVTISIPEIGYTYAVGRDSDVVDEYWIQWLSYPGSDPAVVSITVVKRIRSRAMGDLLREHVPLDFGKK